MKGGTIGPVKEQRGVVLILALFVMVLLSLQALAFLTLARTEDAIATNVTNHTQTFYAAEAGLESGLVGLRALLASTAAPTDAQLADIDPPTLSDPSYTFDTFDVKRLRPTERLMRIESGPYAGLMGFAMDYLVTAEVSGPRGSRARLTQIIQYTGVPLFQFGVLYGKGVDLEIAPGAPMTFSGRVHANSNVYVVNSDLQFDSSVTTIGSIFRYIKRDPETRGSDPQIKDAAGTYRPLNFDHEYDRDFDAPWSADEWKESALSTFDGLVLDSAMGVEEIVPPVPELFTNPDHPEVVSHQLIEKGDAADSVAMKEAKLYYRADLIIDGDKGYDQSGNEVHGVKHCKDADGEPAVRKGVRFYDKREQKEMEVTEIDVGALMACDEMPDNGILYVHAKEPGGDRGKGVRLVNGVELPAQGLTVVLENPVYIQGNYNTEDKKPAAVIADAVTVLSNNWGPNDYDSNGDQSTSSRPASNTTVNAALALGPSAESVEDEGNGQLENVIRFLENWTGVTFTYNGSIVALWHSLEATGDWRCCGDSGDNYYSPPNRNWSFDPLFNTSAPPGTPRGIIVTRHWWSQK